MENCKNGSVLRPIRKPALEKMRDVCPSEGNDCSLNVSRKMRDRQAHRNAAYA